MWIKFMFVLEPFPNIWYVAFAKYSLANSILPSANAVYGGPTLLSALRQPVLIPPVTLLRLPLSGLMLPVIQYSPPLQAAFR